MAHAGKGCSGHPESSVSPVMGGSGPRQRALVAGVGALQVRATSHPGSSHGLWDPSEPREGPSLPQTGEWKSALVLGDRPGLTKRTPCGGRGTMPIDSALPLCLPEPAPGGREAGEHSLQNVVWSRWPPRPPADSPPLLRAPLTLQLGESGSEEYTVLGHFLQGARPQDWVSPGLCLLIWRPSVPTWKGCKGKEMTSEQALGVCPEHPPHQSRVPFSTVPSCCPREPGQLVCFLWLHVLAPDLDPTHH